ncbi:MAG TPA: ABC transporter permease [Trebonia sp.]|jgi:ABC-type transport system involved in multi-copper enzyme maturation permease subunit
MATTTTQATQLSALPPAAGRAGLGGAIASEFTKLRSVRSTYWTLAALLIVSVGLGAAITAGTAASFNNNPANKAGFDATQTALIAFFEIGQLIIAVIAAMTITSEYSTGMIRTSLTAQPRRGVVFTAKAIVLTAVTLVISLITAFVAFFLGQALLSGSGVSASLFHTTKVPVNAIGKCAGGVVNGPHGGRVCTGGAEVTFSGTYTVSPSTVLLAIIGCALFVTLVALIAFGVGALVRHTAAAISIVIAALFIIPIVENALPSNWHDDIQRFLPDAANQVISVTLSGTANAHLWSAWPQLGITALWAVALLAAGVYVFRKRDA